jgi:hypothetical protein
MLGGPPRTTNHPSSVPTGDYAWGSGRPSRGEFACVVASVAGRPRTGSGMIAASQAQIHPGGTDDIPAGARRQMPGRPYPAVQPVVTSIAPEL